MPLRLSQTQAAALMARKPLETPSRKYRNVPTTMDGTRFDSTKEAARWAELQLLQRQGLISHLERQVPYVLAPSVKFQGAARAQPPLRLVVDFRYQQDGRLVLEDCKGGKATQTAAFVIKRHLLLHVHGLQLLLT
jgi:hypothetical protein